MPKPLVIVESPAKAKTIEGFLGRDRVTVLASYGHIRDLPSSAKEVPKNVTDPQVRQGAALGSWPLEPARLNPL